MRIAQSIGSFQHLVEIVKPGLVAADTEGQTQTVAVEHVSHTTDCYQVANAETHAVNTRRY